MVVYRAWKRRGPFGKPRPDREGLQGVCLHDPPLQY